MPYQEIGDAPSRHGHAQVVLLCDVCGDRRTTRANMWRKQGLKHVCKRLVTADDAVEAMNVPAKIDALEGSLIDLKADVRELVGLVETLREQRQQDAARIAALEKGHATLLGGGPFIGSPNIPALPEGVPKFDLKAAVAAACLPEPADKSPADLEAERKARKASRDAQWKRALELAYLPYPQRTPELGRELLQHRTELVEILDNLQPFTPQHDALSEINKKISKSVNDWRAPHFDLAVQLGEKLGDD